MELRHLRYFVAVAEELSFTRAAERLHVSQPPLSQQIKQLEEEVQSRLFDRSRRWVRLTRSGRLFLDHARQVLEEVERAVLAARRTMGNESELSVVATTWTNFTAVPRILRCFSEAHREVRIDVQSLNSMLQVRAVKARTVDVGFMFPPPADDALQIARLARYPLVVALPTNHRLAARAQLSPGDLAGESYVMLAADVAPAYGAMVTKYWERMGVSVRQRLKVDQAHAVIDLVAAGAGFALVPSSVQECETQRIVCRRVHPAPPELELALVWPRGVESPAISVLLEVARRIVRQPRPRVNGEGRGDSHSDGSNLSKVPSRVLVATGHARTGSYQPDGPLRAPSEPKLSPRGGDSRNSSATVQAHRAKVPRAS